MAVADEMIAGPALDRAVAEACGFESCMVGFEVFGSWREEPGWLIGDKKVLADKFRPSTDWNDAMLAAEKVGLFDCAGKTMLYRRDGGGWGVGMVEWTDGFAVANTGPEAICRAVLKITGNKSWWLPAGEIVDTLVGKARRTGKPWPNDLEAV